jgi:hypothetical protein
MHLGLDVPLYYIVPKERFCRDMGPALGVNLAEFEFPAYFNFFIKKQRCTLIVDSMDDEESIRAVFGETLLGPAQFRKEENPVKYQEEDFAPDFPREEIPDFSKELKHFRKMPDGSELVIETLLNFIHFQPRSRLKGPFGHDRRKSSEDGDSVFDPEKIKSCFFHRLKFYGKITLYQILNISCLQRFCLSSNSIHFVSRSCSDLSSRCNGCGESKQVMQAC